MKIGSWENLRGRSQEWEIWSGGGRGEDGEWRKEDLDSQSASLAEWEWGGKRGRRDREGLVGWAHTEDDKVIVTEDEAKRK